MQSLPPEVPVDNLQPILIWYVLRNHLANRDLFKPNKDVTKRLENILDRHEEDDEDSESEDPSNPQDSHLLDSAPPRSRRARDIVLNSYEQSIANEVVHPDDIPVSFADIGGLDGIISDLQESVIYPLTMPSLYQHTSPLLSAPGGVLLYGPPGCGKTMLAKALAHESGAVFINVHISTLTEKWYGDSNKLVAAVFSLARKLAPAIVFIDEIDTILGTRRSGDHEASGHVKAEMMTHMDGLASSEKGTSIHQRVLMLGATNRPQDIDDAILRRMPKQFAIGLPNKIQRRRILELLLRDMKLENPPNSANAGPDDPTFDIDALARGSEGMSGSDLKEMCREAAMAPVREAIQKRREAGQSIKGLRPGSMRPLRTQDFTAHMLSTKAIAESARLQIEELRPLAGLAPGSHEKQAEQDSEGFVTTDDDDSESSEAELRSTKKRTGSRNGKTVRPKERRRHSGKANGSAKS